MPRPSLSENYAYEPDDEILGVFETLHERLVRAASAVADEIARRRR